MSWAIFLLIWKNYLFFSCIFSFCSLLWEFYRGTCIIPFVTWVNFTGKSAGLFVEVLELVFGFRACITRSNFNEAHNFKWFSNMQQSMLTIHPGRGRFWKRFLYFKLIPKGALHISDILRCFQGPPRGSNIFPGGTWFPHLSTQSALNYIHLISILHKFSFK